MTWGELGVALVEQLVELIGAVAWPLVVLTIARLFRAQLAALADRIASLEYGDVKVNLERTKEAVAEVKAEAKAAIAKETEAHALPPATQKELESAFAGVRSAEAEFAARIEELAERDPSEAVDAAFDELRRVTVEVARNAGGGSLLSFDAAGHYLAKEWDLADLPSLLQLVRKLRRGGHRSSRESALDYARLVAENISMLRTIEAHRRIVGRNPK